jgi:hypothetical protein
VNRYAAFSPCFVEQARSRVPGPPPRRLPLR